MSIILGAPHVESVFIANIEPVEDPSIDWERVTEHTFAEKMIDLWFKGKLLFTESNGYVYIDAQLNQNNFYCFWQTLDGKRTLIHQFFRPLFIHYIGALKFYKVKYLSDSKDDIKLYDSLEHLIKKLDSPAYRCGVVKSMEVICFKSESEIQWNNHPNYFVFKQNIVDLDTKLEVKSFPGQFINVSAGYFYDQWQGNANARAEAKQEILLFLDSITGSNTIMVRYLLKVMSTFLRQGNIEEKCYFLLGGGRNGKGMCCDACAVTLLILYFHYRYTH